MSGDGNQPESKLETPLDWRRREIVSTPLLLGGLGDIGQTLAERFMAMLQTCPNVGGQIQLFYPSRALEEQSPDPLGRLSQAASTQGQPVEVEIVLLLAGWQFTAAYTDAVGRLDRFLTAIARIKPVLTLGVLLPPPEARIFHAQARDALPAIERLAASLATPGRVLLFETAAPAPEVDSGELMEALFRALVDAEIAELLHDHTRRPGRGPEADNPPVYGALAVQRLCSRQTALLEHLEARFQQDLFWRGLMNLNRLGAAQRKALQARAHEFLRDCAGSFAEQYQHFPEVVANLPGAAPAAAEAQQIQELFEAEFAAAEQQIQSHLSPYFATLEQRLWEEFATILDHNPAGLAGGRYYLAALATGLRDIREEFCRKPLQTGVAAYYEARLEKLIASFRLPVAGAGQESATTVRTIVAALRRAVSQSTAVDHIPARFLAASWGQIDAYLQQDAPSVAAAQDLLSTSCSLFLARVLPVAEQLQAIQRRRQDALRPPATSATPPASWIKRLLPHPRSDGKQQSLPDSLAVLEQEQAQFQSIYANLYRFSLGLISELLWPQIVRVLIVEGFSSRLHNLSLEFTAFWAGVGAACTERLRDADYRLEGAGPATIPIVGQAQLDTLYAATVGATEWSEYAAKALLFQPGALAPSSPPAPTLWDHFRAGPSRLLQRLTEFTTIRLALLSTRDALDLLELNGTGPARELLQQALSRAQLWQPKLAQPAPVRCINVLRSTPRILAELEHRYGEVFGPDTYYLEYDEPQVIDLTVLITGFSATLLVAAMDAATPPPA